MINDFVNDDELNDRSEDAELPGYPHYPASEDITNPTNGKKVDADLENMNRSVPGSGVSNASVSERLDSINPEEEPDDDLIIVPGTEADVTAEDLILLGPRDQDMDLGDDELLRGKVEPVSTEDDLDIPGSELDDEDELIGEEDEENNYYSLGGDNKDSLEEDNQQ